MTKLTVSGSLWVAALTACAMANPDTAPGRAAAVSQAAPSVAYLPRSHSHNNYEQARPLHGALERGFASVEVDVVLHDGELYVAHGPDEIRAAATLTTLYLEPLRQLVRRNGGAVYGPSDPPLQLLIDVKSEAAATYDVLHRTLEAYADILTSWTEEEVRWGAVSTVLSGNRAIDVVVTQALRYVALDGRVEEDRSAMPVEVMPLVSADWEKLGPAAPAARLAVARTLVERLHDEGRKVRFWGTPEQEELWRSLVSMGVDYIVSDDIARLDRALREMSEGAGGLIDD